MADKPTLPDRVALALIAHHGVFLPAFRQLMEEAWEEGARAALDREHAYGAEEKSKYANPYKAEEPKQ